MWFSALKSLFYPELCIACGGLLLRNESFFCLACFSDLPLGDKDTGHRIQSSLYGRLDTVCAFSLFEMKRESSARKVLHEIKYKGQKEAAHYLGTLSADRWKVLQLPTPDLVIPVPLHYRKKKIRGYNQSEEFARGICDVLGCKMVSRSVRRISFTKTQTHKSRFERWQNVEKVFEWKAKQTFEGTHILLADDVITTGSTLEALAKAIREKFNCRVSVCSIAVAVS